MCSEYQQKKQIALSIAAAETETGTSGTLNSAQGDSTHTVVCLVMFSSSVERIEGHQQQLLELKVSAKGGRTRTRW